MTREEIYGISTAEYLKELGTRYLLVQLEYDVGLLLASYEEKRKQYKSPNSTTDDFSDIVQVQDKYYDKLGELNRVTRELGRDV